MPPHATLQHQGYRLTTAEILYHLPDHPTLLQSYLWQEYDLLPRLPVLAGFLTYWQRSIEGRIHSVKVATAGLCQPIQLDFVDHEFVLH